MRDPSLDLADLSRETAPLRFTVLRHDVGKGFDRGRARNPVSGQPDMPHAIASGAAHWDWLFEPDSAQADDDARLWTFATDPMAFNPFAANGTTSTSDAPSVVEVPAIRLPDHRRIYLDYQGPLSGDRGHVWQIVSGSYARFDDACDDPFPLAGALTWRTRDRQTGQLRISIFKRQCADASAPNSSLWMFRLESAMPCEDSS